MKWLWPIILLILITPLTPLIDLAIARYFYDDGHFVNNAFTHFVYHYATLPGFIALGLAIILFIGSYFLQTWQKYRVSSLLFVLTLAVGAGIIVHGALKDHWGRPRPKQVIEFGGDQAFRPYYEPNFFDQPEPSKSFSCGHCTMGFCFIALILAARRLNNLPLYYLGWILTLGLGITLSVTRMAQGGHFFSDTLVSALVMYLTAISLEAILLKNRKPIALFD